MCMVLKQSLERVVVSVFIDIERFKNIKRVAEVDISWNRRIALEDWEEVHSADYRVNVDHGHNSIPIAVSIGFYNPHPIVRIWFVERPGKVVDECA